LILRRPSATTQTTTWFISQEAVISLSRETHLLPTLFAPGLGLGSSAQMSDVLEYTPHGSAKEQIVFLY
jgi:hypothetical protein